MGVRVTIIAEAAQGYEGDLTLARLLVRAAARGGADFVKFQLVYADELATPDYPHYALFRKLEMPPGSWHAVAAEAVASSIGIAFDVFGTRSLETALDCGASAVKIHATDFFNHPMIDAALRLMPAVYLSAGGITVEEIDEFLRRHAGHWEGKLTLLYGFQAEPTSAGDNNLARLGALRERFPAVPMGFTDHADGRSDEAAWLGVLAVPLGVRAIEKHITLDPALHLEDSVSALACEEFARYVSRIRVAEMTLGSPDLQQTQAEAAYRARTLKSVVTAVPIEAGAVIRREALALLRTGPLTGSPFRRIEDVEGRSACRAIATGRAVEEDDLA